MFTASKYTAKEIACAVASAHRAFQTQSHSALDRAGVDISALSQYTPCSSWQEEKAWIDAQFSSSRHSEAVIWSKLADRFPQSFVAVACDRLDDYSAIDRN